MMQTLVLLANPLNTDLAGAIVRLVRQLRERAAARMQAVWRGRCVRTLYSLLQDYANSRTSEDRWMHSLLHQALIKAVA